MPIRLHPSATKRDSFRTLAPLRIVFDVFENFTYTDELTSGPTTALVFTARVGDRQVEGVDLVRDAEDGSIADLTVIVRPMSGLQALAGAVAEGLGLRPTSSKAEAAST